MNLFSSLLNGIGNAVSTGYNYVTNGVSNLFKGSSGQSANALDFNNPANNALQQDRQVAASMANSMGVPPAKPYSYQAPATSIARASLNQMSNAGTLGTTNLVNQIVTAGVPRPLIQNAAVQNGNAGGNAGINVRGNNPDVGQPYQLPNGQIVIPKVAFSGDSGDSGGQSFNYAPPPLGAPGTAGGSSKTGLLNAAGGLYTPSIPFASSLDDEAQKAADAKKKAGTDAFSGAAQAAFPQGMSLQNGLIAGFNPPTPTDKLNNALAAPTPNQPLPTTPTGATINVADHQAIAEENTKFTNNSYATSTNDHLTTLADQANTFNTNYDAQTAKNPPIPNSHAYTDEQADSINTASDPYGVKSAMDAFIASQTQLPQLTASRVDLMNKINAANETYQKIFDDIKYNPDLPKGLSARRLEYQAKIQKPIVDGFVNQLQVVTQQIQDQNELVNRNFQIAQFAANQADKARDNARADLKLYIDTGTIGAFSNKDIQSFAASTGISASVIQKMRDTATDPNVKSELTGDAASGHYLVTYNTKTGKLIGKTEVSAPTANQNVGGAYGDSLYQQVKTRSVDFNTLPADTKKAVLAEFASRGETMPRPLTTVEKAASNDAISALGAVDDIETFLNKNKGALATNFFLGDTIGGRIMGNSQLINNIKEATDVKTRIRTGAALNASEVQFYGSQAPAFGDSAADITKKLNNLKGFYAGMAGVPVTVVSPDGKSAVVFDDLFNNKQRLGLRKAISGGYSLSY